MIKEPEIWKDIKGYKGLYQVSNYGNIISFKRYKKGKRLKLNYKNGYLYIKLHKDIKRKSFRIHRLVAIHFIDNPLNKEQVNHKDGNKRNNYYKNLEWATNQENVNHAWSIGLCENIKSAIILNNKKYKSKEVYCYELDKKYKSITIASEELNIKHSNISACCSGKLKSAGKHPATKEKLTWKYI